MDFKPKVSKLARERLEKVFSEMDREDKKRKNKPPTTKGARIEFLEKYKVEGYYKAKKIINSKYGKDVYNDNILKLWIKEDEQR